ncbi:hypothetical protein [Acidaminococcus massiliensis]|uniref:hypothetical protein n=1 Tax=Acidaminococcus massiliensis TaxID=1852375 RepID=UPI0022E86709|nr:hypothetical protein [Acidaminococcus massiliensis]
MKKNLFLPILFVSLFLFPSLLFAQEKEKAVSPTAVSVTNEAKEAKAPDGTAAWTLAGANSNYEVYYDTRSIQYDEKTGILTLWNKWVKKGTVLTGTRTTLLLSRYDVRLRVCADLYQYTYNGLGKEISHGKSEDPSWYPLSPNTLGMELCEALKGVLLNN